MNIPFNIFGLIILISCLTLHVNVHAENYVQEACSVTRYQDICLKTLATFSRQARRSPSRWARAAVSVTIGEVKLVNNYLNNLQRHGHVSRRRDRVALHDCVENVQDSLDNLYKSLNVLRKLSYESFSEDMNDVLTWLSASLTDQDSCVEGFDGKKGMEFTRLCSKVKNVGFITSNALAFANKLATSGLQGLEG